MADKIRQNPFDEGVAYIRVACAALMERAQRPCYAHWQRIEWAALAQMNRDGHACFCPNELRHILGYEDEDGIWQMTSAQIVTNAIATAKRHGAIGDDSSAKCIVMDVNKFNQGRGSFGCPVHKKYTVAA